VSDERDEVDQAEQRCFASYSALTKMNLEPFDGSFESWPCFWDVFNYEIHCNSRLTTLEKMRLLSLLLRGDAREQVRAYGNRPTLYANAIADLRDTYDRPLLVRDSLVDSLRNRPRSFNDVLLDLRQMVRLVDAMCATFQTLQLPDRRHETDVREIVWDQLNRDLQAKFSEMTSREMPEIQRFLRRELRRLETLASDCNKKTFAFDRPSASTAVAPRAAVRAIPNARGQPRQLLAMQTDVASSRRLPDRSNNCRSFEKSRRAETVCAVSSWKPQRWAVHEADAMLLWTAASSSAV
jgi:hypothetical protein